MLVPVTMSTGMPSSSIYLITPRCARPRAPPPARTRPTVGRYCRMESIRARTFANAAASASGWALSRIGLKSCAPALPKSAHAANKAAISLFIVKFLRFQFN